MIKLSDYVVEKIAAEGVKHVFMLPGGGAMHLNDSLGRCPGLEFVCNLHEQACSIAAEAYGKITNNLGVAMVTSGPGSTNALTGVAGAWLDSTPCMVLSGQVKRADLKGDSGLRMLGVQEIDIVSMVRSITKYAVTVTDPTTVRYHVERAIYEARSGRRGPVWLDFPLDVQAAKIDPDAQPGYTPPSVDSRSMSVLRQQVADSLRMLGEAERPVLLVGNGVRLAGGLEDFRRVVDRLCVPVLMTWLGLDLLEDAHPLNFGRPGGIAPRGANFTLQNCDLLLVVGARLDMALTAYAHDRLARGAKKVMVDIDEAEIAKMKTNIDLPIVADAAQFLRELLRQIPPTAALERPKWVDRCADWRRRYPLVLESHRNQRDGVSMYYFSEVLSEELAEGDVVAPGSSGFACEMFLLNYKAKRHQRVFHNRGTGAMGFGLPASIGACVAAGRQRTICVDGDGGFQMNIQELATVAHLSLPIKFFVVNNGGYASIRVSQSGYFGLLVGADETSGLELPDVCAVAAAYGLRTARIDGPDDLRQRIRDILDADGPIVCEVRVPHDEPRGPRVTSAQRPDGSMVSKPLEDLWPFLDRDEFRRNMIVAPIEE